MVYKNTFLPAKNLSILAIKVEDQHRFHIKLQLLVDLRTSNHEGKSRSFYWSEKAKQCQTNQTQLCSARIYLTLHCLFSFLTICRTTGPTK